MKTLLFTRFARMVRGVLAPAAVAFTAFTFTSCSNKDMAPDSAPPAAEIKLTHIQLPIFHSMPAGTSATLPLTFVPPNATGKTIYWQIPNPADASKAEIDALTGKITAKTCASYPCSLTVKALTSDASLSAECKLYITNGTQLVTTLAIEPAQIVIEAGKEMQISAVMNEDATDKSLQWSSSNSSIVEVNAEGRLNAKQSGKATITAKAKDGSNKEAKSSVTVSLFSMVHVPVPAGGITFPTKDDDSTNATLADSFTLGETEVTYKLWKTVTDWATDSGGCQSTAPNIGKGCYTFGESYLSKNGWKGSRIEITFNNSTNPPTKKFTWLANTAGSENQPVAKVNWRDAIVFCNALTEWFNATYTPTVPLDAVYYTEASYTTVLRTSTNAADMSLDFSTVAAGSQDKPYIKSTTASNTNMPTTATGFRLPTSAEWELAARYQGRRSLGNSVSRLSNGDTYHFSTGKSASGAKTYYQDADDKGEPAKAAFDEVAVYDSYWINIGAETYKNKGTLSSANAATLKPNALGLYDMSGNISEWMFDADGTNKRVQRGGNWYSSQHPLQVGIIQSSAPYISGASDVKSGLRIGRNRTH